MQTTLEKTKNRLREPEDGFSGIVQIPAGPKHIEGVWTMPAEASGIVLFAHGSGSSRHSRRNRFVASKLVDAGIGTLLLDLLTSDEETEDSGDARFRFDIEFLTDRLIAATRYVQNHPFKNGNPLGYFGASTGAAAAISAASILDGEISAVVSRGGRPDLAYGHLKSVKAPTLLIVGGHDEAVLQLNRDAFDQLRCIRRLAVVPGATHLFEEPGALEKVAELAAKWFSRHLAKQPEPESSPTI
jgi:putative phosphoribosyl transferase